jgi:curved DNA-binding protein CbpA
MFKDYYDILNLSPRASGEDVRAAFKHLALLNHPDRAPAGANAGGAHVVLSDTASSLPGVSALLDNKASSSFASPPEATTTQLSTSCVKDFTDIQEAYEVLSDVARRYLYDITYQEALLQQEQQRQDEQLRRDERKRALEEATRHAREREYKRQLQMQPLNTAGVTDASSPPPLMPQSTHAESAAAHHSTTLLSSSSVVELPPISKGRKTLQRGDADTLMTLTTTAGAHEPADMDASQQGDEGARDGRGLVDSTTGFPLTSSQQQRRRRGRGGGRVRGRGNVSNAASSLDTTAGSRLLARQHSPQSKRALCAPLGFLVTNSLTFATERSTDALSATLPTRAAGGRPGSLRDSPAELPMEYYHQRAIERTLRVFFDGAETT